MTLQESVPKLTTNLFLLAMAFAGVIGDPLNGALFDLFDSYRPMFLMTAVYSAPGFFVVRRIDVAD